MARALGTALRIAIACGVALALAGGAIAVTRAHRSATRATQQPAAPPAEGHLEVEISGCAAILEGPACEVADGEEVRLWVANAARVELWADQALIDPAALATLHPPDGQLLRVNVPPAAKELRVRAVDGARASTWRIRLMPARHAPAVVEKASALRKAGRLDEAAAALEAEKTVSANEPSERAPVVAALARIEYARGHVERAVTLFHESIDAHRAEGMVSEASDDAYALAFLMLERHRFREVRELLVQAKDLSRDYAEGRARGDYYEGMLAWYTGDLRAALRHTREAESHATRLGVSRLRRVAREASARQLENLGRNREAVKGLRELLASDGAEMAPCDRADLLDNVGWSLLLLADRDPASLREDDARAPIEQALALFLASCPDPNRIANARVNLALAELMRGRLAQASAALDEARRIEHEPWIPTVLFWLHLKGRIAIASKDPQRARDSFAREAELAEAVGAPEDERLAAEDRAALLIALGREEDALAILASADAQVDASSVGVPLGEGRDTFFGAHDRIAVMRVELLTKAHRLEEAMHVARRARARLLSALQRTAALESLDEAARARWQEAVGEYRRARDAIDADATHDWELSSDRLAAALAKRKEQAAHARALLDDALAVLAIHEDASDRPQGAQPSAAEGEIVLLYFPASDGWLGFARDRAGVTSAKLGAVDSNASLPDLARKLLEPFHASLARATRVRVLLYGALRSIDVHALPFDGAPLLEHAIVEYPLDLGAASVATALPQLPPPRRALVVFDPSGDLPAARAEAEAVIAVLGASPGWDARTLHGSSATSDVVRGAIASSVLFHYAGHAQFGGFDGLESALPLAEGGKLTPGDVLALPEVPPLVALFGCETGRESAEGTLGALGLAHAFLAAGARSVIGSTRIVDDGLARDVARDYYARLPASPLDPAGALRDALRAARARPGGSQADWAAFRALAP